MKTLPEMMTSNTQASIKPNNSSFKDLIAQFKTIKDKAFSGNLIIQVEAAPRWMFSFSMGRLASISGGLDSVNRWQRNLGIACLDLPLDRLIKTNIQGEIFLNSNTLAQQWVVREILFDIIQFSQNSRDRLSYQLISINNNNTLINPTLPLLDIELMLSKAIQDWQEWLNAGFGNYFPSRFPVISKSGLIGNDELQHILSSIDGNRSLRSLAIHHQQYLLDFTKSLSPLLKSGSIVLSPQPKSQLNQVEVPNLTSQTNKIASSRIIDEITSRSHLNIACIDDSITIYHHLETILTEHGYRCFGVQDPLKIMPTLIKNKPDFIFLDLLMPITNGYEVCEQIRKTPSLKNVPVVILTGKDGLIDRMRAKIVGADGFISKPVQSTSVIKMLDKHLSSSKQMNSKSWLN